MMTDHWSKQVPFPAVWLLSSNPFVQGAKYLLSSLSPFLLSFYCGTSWFHHSYFYQKLRYRLLNLPSLHPSLHLQSYRFQFAITTHLPIGTSCISGKTTFHSTMSIYRFQKGRKEDMSILPIKYRG